MRLSINPLTLTLACRIVSGVPVNFSPLNCEVPMSPFRTVLAILCAFVTTWVTDFITHGVLLQAEYAASMSMWRPEAEMVSHMPWLLVGQFIAAATMTLVYIRGFAARHCLKEACWFGLLMGLFSESLTPILYAVQPLPESIAIAWCVSGAVQGVIVGLVLYAVCWTRKDVAACPASAS